MPIVPQPWHAKARELRSQNYTFEHIADEVNRSLNTVRKLFNPKELEGMRRRQLACYHRNKHLKKRK